MKRASIVIAVVVGLLSVPAIAQQHPNFSGTWELVASTPDNTWAMGKKFVATQDGRTLLIERLNAIVRIDNVTSNSPRSASSTSPAASESARDLYQLDGSEVHRIFPPPPAPRRPDLVISGGTEESTSTVTWQDQELVIFTKNVLLTTYLNGNGVRRLQTVRNVLHFERENLVVDHQITVEPLVPTTNTASASDQPPAIRSTYRKVS